MEVEGVEVEAERVRTFGYNWLSDGGSTEIERGGGKDFLVFSILGRGRENEKLRCRLLDGTFSVVGVCSAGTPGRFFLSRLGGGKPFSYCSAKSADCGRRSILSQSSSLSSCESRGKGVARGLRS